MSQRRLYSFGIKATPPDSRQNTPRSFKLTVLQCSPDLIGGLTRLTTPLFDLKLLQTTFVKS